MQRSELSILNKVAWRMEALKYLDAPERLKSNLSVMCQLFSKATLTSSSPSKLKGCSIVHCCLTTNLCVSLKQAKLPVGQTHKQLRKASKQSVQAMHTYFEMGQHECFLVVPSSVQHLAF